MTDVNPDDPFVVHEVFHTACVLMETWHEQVIDHPALENKPEVAAMAAEAFSRMHDVYAALGAIRGGQDA
jgi:predicted solute-binding protein